jgi:hypothetical protein
VYQHKSVISLLIGPRIIMVYSFIKKKKKKRIIIYGVSIQRRCTRMSEATQKQVTSVDFNSTSQGNYKVYNYVCLLK